jgi:Zn-dependent M28 family amino/carboxypeptidase
VSALRGHVETLAGEIGPRCDTQPEARARSAEYIRAQLASARLAVEMQSYGPPERGFVNVSVEPRDGPEAAQLVIGAHYDTVCETPGADDNASGVAVLIEVARMMGPHVSTTRFIAFATEEASFPRSAERGSGVAARASRARGEDLRGMVALEMLGFYREERGSQSAPPSVTTAGDRGDFLALVANPSSRAFLDVFMRGFGPAAALRTRTLVASSVAVGDIERSDHASYWEAGYPAIMLTDTAEYRNPNYHRPSDTPDTLDYARMGEVVMGLAQVIAVLSR